MGTLFISLSSRGWRFLSRGDFLMYIRAFCCSWRLLRSGAAQPSTFFMGRLRQCTGITLPSPLAKTGISGTELILRPFAIARLAFFQPRRSPYADQRTGGRRRLLRSGAAHRARLLQLAYWTSVVA